VEDARSFRVALIADKLVNPGPDSVDGLSVLDGAGWGAITLPPDSCPGDVAAEILDQVAEQVDEFRRNGYDVVLIGSRSGVEEALSARRISALPTIRPSSTREIRAFLRGRPPPAASGELGATGRVES
jgi:hypothetical protein